MKSCLVSARMHMCINHLLLESLDMLDMLLVYALLSVHVMLWPPFRQALVKRHASLLTCRVTANVVTFCNAVLTHLLQVVTSCTRLCCSCTLT